jgi:steroid 5-alpha reductase family enzyme
MNFLLYNISIGSMLEKSLRKKKSGFQENVETTNFILPWIP